MRIGQVWCAHGQRRRRRRRAGPFGPPQRSRRKLELGRDRRSVGRPVRPTLRVLLPLPHRALWRAAQRVVRERKSATQRVGRERKEKKHSAIRTVETQRKARRNQQLSRSLCAIWGLENGCSTRAEDRAPALFWRTHPPPRRTTPRRGRPRRQQRAPAGKASPSRRPSIGCHQSLLPRWTMRWTLSRVENMIQQAKLKERPKQCRGRSKRDAVGNAYSTRAKAICIQCVELKES